MNRPQVVYFPSGQLVYFPSGVRMPRIAEILASLKTRVEYRPRPPAQVAVIRGAENVNPIVGEVLRGEFRGRH